MKAKSIGVLLLLAVARAHAQDAPASAAAQSFTAYAAAEDCMRNYGRRFSATSANPQDVADAALSACYSKRYAAAVEAAQRRNFQTGAVNAQADEPALRRLAIQACIEARFQHAR